MARMMSYGRVISKPTDPLSGLEAANSIAARPVGGLLLTFGGDGEPLGGDVAWLVRQDSGRGIFAASRGT